MEKRIIISIIFVLILGAGGFFYCQQNPEIFWPGKAQVDFVFNGEQEEIEQEEIVEEIEPGETRLAQFLNLEEDQPGVDDIDEQIDEEKEEINEEIDEEIEEEEDLEEGEKDFAGCQENQLNINRASAKELEALRGVGPVISQRIIEEREIEFFYSLNDLTRVRGIGEKIVIGIKEQNIACAGSLEEGLEFLTNDEEEVVEEEEKSEEDVCWVNINTASISELQKITGIGPVLAQRIIEARIFFSIYDLTKVSGIGDVILQKIVDQNCAYVEGDTGKSSFSSGSEESVSYPEIICTYPEEIFANEEIEVILFASNFKNVTHDVKISIEKNGVLSQIYSEKKEGENKWQSSAFYLIEVFSSTSFEGQFRLKIRDDKQNFQGEADIIVRIRETGKNSFTEFKGKINIIEPESEDELEKSEESDPEPDPPLPPADFLLNPGFEEGDGANADYWTHSTTKTERSQDYAKTNEWSMRMEEITTNYNGREFTSHPVIIEAGKTYEFGGWYYLVDPGIGAEPDDYRKAIRVIWLDDNQDEITTDSSFIDFKIFEEWTEVIVTEIAPENAEYVQLRIQSRRNNGTTNVYWDDMFIIGPMRTLTIDVLGKGTTEPAPDTYYFESGEEVTIIAYPDEGWEFVGWTGDEESEENTITIIIDSDKNITANFEEEISDPEPSDNLLLNEFFEEWENEDTKPTYWTGSHSFNTNWFQDYDALVGEYSVRVGASGLRILDQTDLPVEAGIYYASVYLKGGGQARVAILMGETGHTAYGDWVDIQVDEWTEVTHNRNITAGNQGGIRIQTENEANMLIGAAWFGTTPPPEDWVMLPEPDPEPDPIIEYNLTINVNGQGTTDPAPGTYTYEENKEVIITATAEPDNNWKFINWTDEFDNLISEEVTIIVVMDEDKNITANFEEQEEGNNEEDEEEDEEEGEGEGKDEE